MEKGKTYKVVAAAAAGLIIVSGIARFLAINVLKEKANMKIPEIKSVFSKELTLAKELSFETENFTLSSGSYPVKITQSPDGKIYVKQYAEKDITEKELMQSEESKDGVTVKIPAINNLRIASRRYLEIALPKSCGTLSLISSSGGISADCSVNAREFSADISSGSFKVGGISAENISLSSKSGGIKCGSLSGNVKISSASGGITLEELNGAFEIRSASGGIRLDKICGGGKISVFSGGIKAVFADISDNVAINVTSGGVKVDVPKNSDISLSAKATSGTVSAPEMHGGKYNVNISAVSGGISVSEI